MNMLRLVLALSLLTACTTEDSAPEHQPDASTPTPDERDPEPEGSFTLSFDDKLPILQGTNEQLHVTIERKDGFSGAIRLSATGLPERVQVQEGRVHDDEDEATLVFRAPPSAPHSLPTAVTIHGAADSGDASATRTLTVTVYGPPGSLDTSFAGGKQIVSIGASDDYAHAMTVADDGKIIVAGQRAENQTDFALLRLERDGAVDQSFGTDGIVSTQVGSGADIAYAVALQRDGKILAAGSSAVTGSGLDFALVRYNEDGSLDTTFGDDGIVTTAFGPDSDTAYALLVQPDGKIVLGGESNQGASKTGVDFALARYNEDGSLDTAFGDGGKVLTAISSAGGGDSIYALAWAESNGEGRILAAGGEGDFKLVSYREDGSLDTSFADAGKLSGVFGSTIGAARALAVLSDGSAVLAGHREHDFALAKVTPDGALDTQFGDAGKVITAVSKNNWDEARGVVVDADDKILAGGWAYEGDGTSGNFALVRYSASGELDEKFGNHGLVISEVAAAQKRDEAAAIWLQSDERVPTVRVLLAGNASQSDTDFAITRYWR